ncbi:MAG: DUF177 domain-containing protein [Verrucomicrobia bacterium]|nr:DUF177 domain-containing protein [Verrucomicrobiota bacterium]MDA1086727.1 DUF177 domain-containing protein [Verrucomicrobiota bacterium]
MIVDLAKVSPEGDRFIGQEPPGAMDLSSEESVEIREGLRYDLTVQVLGDELLARGRVELDLACRCSRCAEFFATSVFDGHFDLIRELPEKDRLIDLTEDLREAIVLGFPSYPLCSDNCKGLCAQCGVNLNNQSCQCKPVEDDRWNGLQDFTLE